MDGLTYLITPNQGTLSCTKKHSTLVTDQYINENPNLSILILKLMKIRYLPIFHNHNIYEIDA